ncbi:MAG: SWIM zinc finger family protein [Acidobacteriota bacterium]
MTPPTPAYSREQVLALAPDAASIKACQKLLNPAKWPVRERDPASVWGECRGSGKEPYRVEVDLAGPAFRCSCPSRKFPCKHALALLLMLADDAGGFAAADPPPRVREWLESRAERAEKRATRGERSSARQADPERAARRAATRRAEIEAGLVDFERWLRDLVRQGLASAQERPPSFWTEPARRLVDAKAPGLASRVHRMSAVAKRGAEPEKLLALAGEAFLLRTAFARFDALPAPVQGDVRAALGWPVETQAVLAGESVRGPMRVLGVSVEERESLRERRFWLRSSKGSRDALLLDFAHGTRPFENLLVPGTVVDLDLAYYPSAAPLRAVIKERHGEEEAAASAPGGAADFAAGLEEIASYLAANPWLARLPLALAEALPLYEEGRFQLEDGAGRRLPLHRSFQHGWSLLAFGGGRPLEIFGEWRGDSFLPLSCWTDGVFQSLSGPLEIAAA